MGDMSRLLCAEVLSQPGRGIVVDKVKVECKLFQYLKRRTREGGWSISQSNAESANVMYHSN